MTSETTHPVSLKAMLSASSDVKAAAAEAGLTDKAVVAFRAQSQDYKPESVGLHTNGDERISTLTNHEAAVVPCSAITGKSSSEINILAEEGKSEIASTYPKGITAALTAVGRYMVGGSFHLPAIQTVSANDIASQCHLPTPTAEPRER